MWKAFICNDWLDVGGYKSQKTDQVNYICVNRMRYFLTLEQHDILAVKVILVLVSRK